MALAEARNVTVPGGDRQGSDGDPSSYGELSRNLREFLAVSSREERYVGSSPKRLTRPPWSGSRS